MAQAHDPNFPQSASGSLYPTDYVVGVIDDLQEAQQAIKAFEDAGYDANEIRLMESQEALQKTEELDEHKNWFQRLISSFQSRTDETGVDIYQYEAEQGNHILHVHANSQDEVEKITALMRNYHAHAIKFFGRWSVADMPAENA